jgi:hypothetical protein
MMKKVLLKP